MSGASVAYTLAWLFASGRVLETGLSQCRRCHLQPVPYQAATRFQLIKHNVWDASPGVLVPSLLLAQYLAAVFPQSCRRCAAIRSLQAFRPSTDTDAMQASAGACLLLLRCCISQGVCRLPVSRTTACAVSKFYMSLRRPALCFLFVFSSCRQPCLQVLLLTRKTMTSQFLVELTLRTANLLQFTSRLRFRRQ